MRLKTSHNTFVVIGESGQLLHLPEPTDQNFLSVWNESPPPPPVSVSSEVEITKGPLAPCTMVVLADGLVAFRRNQAYLCAVPDVSELRFEPELIGPWEQFSIRTLDIKALLQPSAAFTNIAPWIKSQEIDLVAASRPAWGQRPVTIEGWAIDSKIAYIKVEPFGRFGNNLYQLINAFWLAKSLDLTDVVLSGFDFINDNFSHGVQIISASNFKSVATLGLCGNFYGPNGFESIFSISTRNGSDLASVISMLGETYKGLIQESSKKRSIALHFRSGDVFVGAGHLFYVQPPASYYLKCFDHALENAYYDIIELIYEDRRNPAIEIVENALSARGVRFESCGTTVAGDICRLLSADCVISSYGTFCEGAAILSNYLRSYYCFRAPSSQDFWHPFSQCWTASLLSSKKINLYICDELNPHYIPPRSWVNSIEQNESIKSFSAEELRLYRY